MTGSIATFDLHAVYRGHVSDPDARPMEHIEEAWRRSAIGTSGRVADIARSADDSGSQLGLSVDRLWA